MMQRVHWCACARVRDSLLQWDVSGGISAQWRWWICAHVINIQMAFGLVEMRDCEVAKTKPKFISRTQSLLKHILASFVRIRTPHQLLRSCDCLSFSGKFYFQKLNYLFDACLIPSNSNDTASPRCRGRCFVFAFYCFVGISSKIPFFISFHFYCLFVFSASIIRRAQSSIASFYIAFNVFVCDFFWWPRAWNCWTNEFVRQFWVSVEQHGL